MFLSFEKLLLPTAEILVNLSSAQPDLTNKYERKPISTGRYRKYWQVQEILAGTGNLGWLTSISHSSERQAVMRITEIYR